MVVVRVLPEPGGLARLEAEVVGQQIVDHGGKVHARMVAPASLLTMSENLAYTDAYARSVPARVLQADGAAVLLDRTVFYPGGGGQPADSGWLRTDDGGAWRVTGARKAGDDVWHVLEEGARRRHRAPGSAPRSTGSGAMP